MTRGYMFYDSIAIACICYSAPGPPPQGVYVYNESLYPFHAPCKTPAIVDKDKHRQDRPARYFSLGLTGCVPPHNMSYAWSLYWLGMLALTELGIHIGPDSAPLTPVSFVNLSPFLEDLRLFAVGDVVVPEPGTLANLNSVRSLTLSKVRPDKLPPQLNSLDIKNTGYKELPPGALDVLHLTVYEPNLTRISGTGHRLKTLKLTGPLTELPLSTSVEDVKLTGMAATLIPAYTSMWRLDMRKLLATKLDHDFLRGCWSLTHFKLVQSNIEELHRFFFHYAKKLKEIDLSYNRFNVIPSYDLTMLYHLEKLKMNNNRLHFVSFYMNPVGPVTTLELNGNPLGDLCFNKSSDLMQLTHLTTLKLSSTNASRICTDWFQSLTNLNYLDLSSNNITYFSCELLWSSRGNNLVIELDLSKNALRVNCSSADYERVLARPKESQLQVKVIGDLDIECSCAAYWFVRIQQDFKVPFTASPNLARCYTDMARKCRVRTRCRPRVRRRCVINYYEDNADVYWVNGLKHTIEYDNGTYFKASCAITDLEDSAFPVFPWKVRFQNVSLYSCRPPSRKHKYYSEILSVLNVEVGENFFLYDLLSDTKFTQVSFAALPSLKHLHLEAASRYQVLVMDKDVLPLVEPLKTLNLVKVYSERMPLILDHINLTDTGFTTLPRGAINALNLTINEKNLTALTGRSYRMQQLTATAPLYSLMIAPTLKVLELTGAHPSSGFVEGYPELHTLKLHRLMLLMIPAELLFGATELRHFTLTHNSYHMMPLDLFSYSPHLKTIDLSYNKLETLPMALFSGLYELTTLTLDYNHLRASSLPSIVKFPSMRDLYARGIIQ